MESYYDTLGVDPTADAAQLRSAYRHAARKTHPDTGGTTEAFHAVQIAWDTLSDPTRRSRYDARNHPAKHSAPAPREQAPRDAAPVGDPDPEPGRTVPPATGAQPLLLRPRWIHAALTIAFLTTGGLTWLILADLGRVFAAVAALFLAAAVVLVATTRAGAKTGERTLAVLLRSAWALGGAFILLGLASWAGDHSPAPGLLWGACVLAFAGSATALLRSSATSDAGSGRP